VRPRDDALPALLDLWERELPDDAYVPRWVRATPIKGKPCWAIAFVGNPASRLYVGGLTVEECVSRVRGAKGQRGSNADYVLNTAQHLRELQLDDARLRAVCAGLG
jgi:cation transport protein ChaC